MFFDYSILNELKRVPTDAPEDETDKYNLDNEEETGEPAEDETNYELDNDDVEDEPTDDESNYELDDEEEPTDDETNYDLENDDTEDSIEMDDGMDEDEQTNDDEGGYDLDDDMEEGDPEEGTEDDTETGEEGTDDVENSDSNNELKDLENKVFNISPTGLDIREKTLKKDYIELYNNINTILDKIRLVPKTSANISVIEFCNKKLYELKSICYDYLLYTYSDKTYIENQKNYITYLGIIANINNLLMQIRPKIE